jgi:transcriptional regulator with XRE-family HTH domain
MNRTTMELKKQRAYSQYTREAATLLGKEIQLARKERRFSASDFADRIGISRITLQRVERGDLKCELGIVFEAAALAGVSLFNGDPASRTSFTMDLDRVNDKLALLPKRIRKSRKDLDDAF